MTISSPQAQTRSMLDWFRETGIETLDIHVRVPKVPGARYDDPNWFWITQHEAVMIDAVHDNLVRWLRYKNASGSDIYIRPHRHGAHPVVFLDDIELEKARCVAKKYRACVIETSPRNTQIWLATDRPLAPNERKSVQSHLRDLGYTDPGSVSGDHLGRLCGMKSQKRGCWVNCIVASNGPRFQPSTLTQTPSIPQGGACASKNAGGAGDSSQSAKEFGWVLGRLRIGTARDTVRRDLLRQATERGKRNAEQYVRLTLENACRRLDMR